MLSNSQRQEYVKYITIYSTLYVTLVLINIYLELLELRIYYITRYFYELFAEDNVYKLHRQSNVDFSKIVLTSTLFIFNVKQI